jgi:diguanylate cyclase (GGDEF)-like protein
VRFGEARNPGGDGDGRGPAENRDLRACKREAARMTIRIRMAGVTKDAQVLVSSPRAADVRYRFLRLLPLLLAWALSTPSVMALPLTGAWRVAQADESPASVADTGLTAFDPTVLTVIPHSAGAAWVVLRPAGGSWPAGELALQVHDPGLQTISFFPDEAPARRASMLKPDPNGWPGYGRIAFRFQPREPHAPALLRFEATDALASPVHFSVVPAAHFQRQDGRWVAFASACFAVMLAMAIMALVFAVELRDLTFVYYAGYLLSYVLIQSIQTGYAAEPLEWNWLAAAPHAWGRAATAASVVFTTLFLARFAELAIYSPRLRRVVLALGYAVTALMLLGAFPWPSTRALASALINPLLILGGPVLLAASLSAAWRGSRYAVFFLVGWTPLLVFTVLSSLQLYGMLPRLLWVTDATIAAGALEALVLSLGLADRSLQLRRDRDRARRLAEIDPLTSVLNRRAFSERLLPEIERSQRLKRSFALLFLDLDDFKLLNDTRGHGAGDEALTALVRLLRRELREQDFIGRHGGEEFVVALPACDLARAGEVAERLRQQLQMLAIPATPTGAVLTVSIGVAVLRARETADSLVARADRAMYAAKAAGRNRVAIEDASA